MDEIELNRNFMKCPYMNDDDPESDQQKNIPHPPLGKAVLGKLIELPEFDGVLVNTEYAALLDIRRSQRVYADEPVTQEQLAFLLWNAQGVRAAIGVNRHATLRPVPSGGARHPFEVYAAVKKVAGLNPGLYRYAPMEHVGEKRSAIEFLGDFGDFENRITDLLVGQSWAAKAPVVLFFSCVPYRAEWRYREAAHRVMLIDLGHVGQNVMLGAAALGLGSCCLAAFDQSLCDAALGLDGTDEYTVYAITIGKPKTRK